MRFSSPEQMCGDSARRQTSLARAYADEFHLLLDESLTYRDLGISSFRSQNATSGRLGAFLDAVSTGAVPPGSVLLVENLDRLSRDNVLVAQNLLTQIVLAGVAIVTLSDRRTYSKAALQRDPMGLIFALLNFIRANEESELKSSRGRSCWAMKRSRAADIPMTAQCPRWLILDPTTKRFIQRPERVKFIQQIFAMVEAGTSLANVNRWVNSSGATGWERSAGWTTSSLRTLLRHSGVVGTLVPYRQCWEHGRRVKRACEPVPGYYPRIIPDDLFQRVQAHRTRQHWGSGNGFGSIVQKIGRCSACGGGLANLRYAAKGENALVCAQARAGLGCKYQEVPHAAVEQVLRARLVSILVAYHDRQDLGGRSDRVSLAQNAADRARRRVKLANIAPDWQSLVERQRVGKDPAWDERKMELLETLAIAEEALRDASEGYQPRRDWALARKVTAAVEGLHARTMSHADRTAVDAALRPMIAAIAVDFDACRLTLRSKDGDSQQFRFDATW